MENKSYIVGYNEKNDESGFHIVNVIVNSLDSATKVIEEHIDSALRRIRETVTERNFYEFWWSFK